MPPFASSSLVLAALAACAADPTTRPPAVPDGSAAPDAGGPEAPSLVAQLLVITVDGREPALATMRQALDHQGTPYVVWSTAARPGELTAATLADGQRGWFQGVILAGGGLIPDGTGRPGALAEREWQALVAYQRAFAVRQVTLFAEPTAAAGFAAPTLVHPGATPLIAVVTPAGRAVFPYLVGALTIDGAAAYLAAPRDAATTALVADAAGHALVALRRDLDGREHVTVTIDGGPTRVHAIALAYGLINWVTRGLFVGERGVFASPQVDDVFLRNRLFASDQTYRLTGDDLRAVAAWQAATQRRPTTAGLVLTLAWNGYGTTGIFAPDSLTPVAQELAAHFRWVNHSWSHLDLDAADAATATSELARNNAHALALGLDAYDPTTVVTPGHSGLANPAAMQAAYDVGIRTLVSNTSRPGQDNPFPNVGIVNALQPELFEVPRHPTEIYFDVTTPAEEVVEYNQRHPGAVVTYAQILAKESDHLLRYMLMGDLDPWMFHQGNLRAADGVHSLLGDLLDETLTKYEQVYDLPVATLSLTDLGRALRARTALHASGVRAIIVPGVSITLSVTREATVPVTGLATATGERYGGQPIAHVRVTPDADVTVPLVGDRWGSDGR